jgi:two-component system, chemotaxis family, CheB/CheR fusion protein
VTELEPGPQFEALLQYLRQTRGFDFTSYKRTTLCRRVAKRMAEVQVRSFDEYIDFLEVHTDEFAQLFDTVLINVTSFFRDPEVWAAVAADVIPRIAEEKSSDEAIRVWSAGCASGEEAYSLAMLFAEALGDDEFRGRVKIYATDLDEGALATARQGAYPSRTTEAMAPELRDKYFEAAGTRFLFRQDLRRSVIFGRHDLTIDAPISRLDLLVCRNTLMYLNAEAQHAVLERLNFALNPDGFLLLGRAEMLLSHPGLFQPVDMKARLFHKVGGVEPKTPKAKTDSDAPATVPATPATGNRHLRELAFDATPVALILLNLDGTVIAVNDHARATFGVHSRDVGRPVQDLELSFRPVELRSRIEQAYAERRLIQLRSVERLFANGPPQYFDVAIQPLPANGEANPVGVLIGYTDVTANNALQVDLKRSSQELETAYEELQSANEELETSNEELQATVEELETTNEELQSANEELETMNEELQATNEELETTNEELRSRGSEMDKTNSFLVSVMASEPAAVIALDHELRVQSWNGAAVELWGLRSEEVAGNALFDLDFGLMPAEGLLRMISACRDQRSPREELLLEATNRRGRHLKIRVIAAPLLVEDGSTGVILLMQEVTAESRALA